MFRSVVRVISIRSASLRPIPRRSHYAPNQFIRRTLSSATQPSHCPQCSAPLPTRLPVCPKCSFITRIPSSTSYHELLGMESTGNPFSVDTAVLKRRFLEAQRVCHPDTWSGQPQEKKDIADQMSSLVNEAYKTLLDPLRRVQYILESKGLEVSETDHLEDKELMMEIMDAREALEDAASQEQVEEIRTQNQEKYGETVKEIEALVGRENWQSAKTAAVRLKYLQGIQDAAKAWPDSVFDH